MINNYSIGDRVTFNGFKGTICSAMIQGKTTRGEWFLCYLVQFDKLENGDLVEFSNAELHFASTIATIHQRFLERII